MFKFFKVGGVDGQFVNQTITALPAGNYNWSFYTKWGDVGHASGPTGTTPGNLPSWSAEGDNQPKFTILVQDADGAWVADQATVTTEPTTVLTWVQDSGTWTNTETRDVRIKFAKNGGTAANGGSNTDKLMYIDDASLTYASALSSSAVDSFPYCTSFDTDLGDWTTEIVSGTSDWTSAASNTTTGSSSVDAYSGGGSAYYYAYNYSGHGSTLMSTAMDISSVVNPQVTFQLANPAWGGDQETLQVWYKAAAGDAWTVLATYTDSSTSFSEVTVGLPNASSDYYIAFNATSGYGYGVLIDDVCVDAAPTEPAMSVTATTDGGSATFSFTIDNFTVGAAAGEGDGHIHWSIFAASDLNTPIYDNVMVYSTDDLTLSPLPNGDHVIVFSLVDANHQPLDPAVEATVEFSTFDGTAACGETVTYTQVANGDYTVALTAPAGQVASVTINATMENNYDYIYVTDGAGNALNADQTTGSFTDAVYTSTDGTVSVNVTNDGSVQNGDVTLAFNCASEPSLELRGVMDLTVPGGGSAGKAVHLYVTADIADLSTYGINMYSNGSESVGASTTLPVAAPTAGQHILIVRDAAELDAYMNASTDFDHVFEDSSVPNGNGDDVVELTMNGTSVDVYGVIGVDGSGTAWNEAGFFDYKDTWAYKVEGAWTAAPVDSSDNTATTCVSEYPYPFTTCAASTFDVTFSVNTTNITVGENGMYAGGGVLGDATAYAMSDDDGDGTWTVTINMEEGTSGNYTFLNSPNDGGDWGAKENLAGQECADANNYNDRILEAVTADTTLLHCFGSCETDGTCPSTFYDVTFSVNTANIEVGPNGMYAGGGVLGDAQAYAMSDDDGDGTWTVTVSLVEGTVGNYTFLNSPNDGGDWGAKEDISGQECADGNNYNDRILAEVTGDITLLHCFGTCDTDGTCSALAVDSFPYCSSFDADLGDWTAESVSGDTNWSSAAENYNGTVVPLSGAGMAYLYDNSSVANLVSLPMDLTSLASPQVTFSYAQPVWAGDQDELRVWYKAAAGDEWSQIAEYTADTPAWETVTLDLPNASSEYYIAFNGTAGYGYGLTIDDVCVATAGVSNEELLAFLGSGSWRSEAETAGHIGVGPSGSTNAEWWNANAYDKADTGLYDDRWSFADGVLTVDTGDDGAIFGKKAEIDAAFPDNTPYDADNSDNEYLYYALEDYTDTFVADATNNTITFATNGNLGFFTSVAGQEFQILETTDNTVYLRNVGSEGNAWYNRLTTADALSTVDAMVLDMRIYPNPSNGSYVTIQTPVNGVKYVEVFDITGKRLINTSLSADTLDVSSMSSGMYLVKVTVEGQSKTSKLIIR